MRDILWWVKEKLGILTLEREHMELRRSLQSHKNFVSEKVGELKEYTRVDADVGYRGNNTIILTGVYRNKGYVKFYDMGDRDFVNLVEHLKDMKGHALIRNIDAPPHFKGTFDLY